VCSITGASEQRSLMMRPNQDDLPAIWLGPKISCKPLILMDLSPAWLSKRTLTTITFFSHLQT
jgi:hypothetical protein